MIIGLLRFEGAVVLAMSITAYALLDASWLIFALLLLSPDLAMLGYFLNKRVGAVTYNLFHSYPLPAFVLAFGLFAGYEGATAVALIWFAHIGLDRMLGYGLKYPDGFKHTHLNRA